MVALDPWHVNHTCGTAQKRAAREGQFWQGLHAAFGDCARAVGDTLAAF